MNAASHVRSGATHRSICLVPAQALARSTLSEMQAFLVQQAGADLVVAAETVPIEGLLPTLEKLARARRTVGHAGDLIVRAGTASQSDLQRLAAVGVPAVAWTVRSPTRLAARLQVGADSEATQLHEAMGHAAAQGLRVQVRWRLHRLAVAALADLTELAEHAAPGTQLIVVPWLPAHAPRMDEVIAHWPRDPLPGLQLVRSELWPACLDLPAAAVEPVPASQIKALSLNHVAQCAGCPHRPICPGVAPTLVQALEVAGQSFRGWVELPPPPRPEPSGGLGFDATCAEIRGLHLGLRRAWRLSLQDADLPRFRALFEPLGYTVAVSPMHLAMVVGGTMRLVDGQNPDAERLVVVAREPDVAAACLQDELGNLTRAVPTQAHEFVDDLEETLAIHRRLGAAYGYPPCCVEAFCDAHAEVVNTSRLADNAIALLRAHLRTVRHDALLDTLGGPATQGLFTPLRHLPCRFDCPESLRQARALLTDLRTLHPGRAHLAETQQALPVIVLADGSFLRVAGQVQGPFDIEAVTAVSIHVAAHATGALRDSLAAMAGSQPDGTALRVEPGRGVSVRVAGAWRELDLPMASEVRMAERFPRLLPFLRE